MLIGIDAHWLEGNRTGVGRYLYNLLRIWSTVDWRLATAIKFILYFKDKIPYDIPKSDLFEEKLLKVGSTAKFIHWDLCRAAKKDKVDILFCPGYITPLFYKGKIALTLHDIIYEAHPEWFEWKSWADRILLRWVSRFSARKAAIIFTISDFSRQQIFKHFKVPFEKICLTYLAADTEERAGQSNLQAVRNRFGLKDKFGFYVGSIFNRRHLPETISAFSRLAKEKSDFQLLLAGKDNTKPSQNVENLIKEANDKIGREAILRVDFVDEYDLKLLYSACAFFVYLSDYEGFGLPPLEAMASGAPIITSDSTSLKEVAGSAALLIKNNSDVDEIYRTMRRLTEDENLRQELIGKGKDQVAKFSWQKCAEETLSELLKA